MSAYAKKIPVSCCRDCPAKAVVEVFNTYGQTWGYFCKRCGRAKLTELHRQETARAQNQKEQI